MWAALSNKVSGAVATATSSFSSESETPVEDLELQVKIGPNPETLSLHAVNDDANPTFIVGPQFIGNVAVRIKDFDGITPKDAKTKTTDYFGSRKRIFSIQVQGRFRKDMSSDDLMFGAWFEDKVSPPYVAYAAFKLAQVIDPALKYDLSADTPWLLSPAFCAMNSLDVSMAPDSKIELDSKADSLRLSEAQEKYRVDDLLGEWTWGGEKELKEDTSALFTEAPFPTDSYTDRRKWFGEAENRESITISSDKIYNMDIFAPFFNFNTFDVSLGVTWNVRSYINGQPIRLVFQNAARTETYVVIQFELVPKQK